jgi:hypothetical protein
MQRNSQAMLNNIKHILSHLTVWWLVAVPLCGCLCEIWVMIHRAQLSAQLVENAVGWWFDCRTHHACLTSDVLGAFGSIRTASGESVTASKETVALIKDVRPRVNTVLDESAATLHAARETITEAHSMIIDLRAGLQPLMKDADETVRQATATLKPLETTLADADSLVRTLDREVAEGSPHAVATLQDLDGTVVRLNALLDNPDVSATLAHVAGASVHLEESAASIDLALRPWREKAHLLKTVIEKVTGLLKFTLPIRR